MQTIKRIALVLAPFAVLAATVASRIGGLTSLPGQVRKAGLRTGLLLSEVSRSVGAPPGTSACQRTERVVLMCPRDAEYRHHRITDELLHQVAMPFDLTFMASK